MDKKLLFALLLMLYHSLMFGVTAAASLPDEDHPFGQAIPHDHLHHHMHDQADEHSHGHSHDVGNQQTVSSSSDDDHHEHQHSHGLNVQLNCDLPYSLSFTLQVPCRGALTGYQVTHQSLTYAPPVPPPNR